jgi:hypothetical protein
LKTQVPKKLIYIYGSYQTVKGLREEKWKTGRKYFSLLPLKEAGDNELYIEQLATNFAGENFGNHGI